MLAEGFDLVLPRRQDACKAARPRIQRWERWRIMKNKQLVHHPSDHKFSHSSVLGYIGYIGYRNL